jgi:ribosome-associated toxin RatA of RatAB toxin-antitoxin module
VRRVEVIESVVGVGPSEMYARLSNFADYAKFSTAVRSIKLSTTEDGRFISDWEVNFREGILCWQEEDTFNAEARTFSFRQLEGDIEHFVGEWSIGDAAEGCLVRFVCDFDLGIPGLNDILEPIAEQALRDNIKSIINGLSSPTASRSDVCAAGDA